MQRPQGLQHCSLLQNCSRDGIYRRRQNRMLFSLEKMNGKIRQAETQKE